MTFQFLMFLFQYRYADLRHIANVCLRFFKKKSWNNAKLRYDGSTFEARVKNVDQYGKMIEVKDTKPLTGNH